MASRTSKKDYVNHKYSGPRKNIKRSRGQMIRYHGKYKSRNEVWCKKVKTGNSNVPSIPVQNTVKVYSGPNKNHIEANDKQYEQQKTEKKHPTPVPLDINWPLINPTVISYELIEVQETEDGPPTSVDPLDIDGPLIDHTDSSHDLIEVLQTENEPPTSVDPLDISWPLINHTDISHDLIEVLKTENEPPTSPPLDINRPLNNSMVNSHELIEVLKTENEPPTSPPLDINRPLIDNTNNSNELIDEQVLPYNLDGLLGNRIVDLAHVLQWAFKMERHRSQCNRSSIVYVNELKEGFNSIFTFKCSMCEEVFRYSNENVEKFYKARYANNK